MKIELTQGFYADVDEEDFECVNQYSWYVVLRPSGVKHAASRSTGKTVYMHNFVLKRKGNQFAVPDHLDGNGLNNKKQNLQIKSRRGNCLNSNRCRTAKLYERHGTKWRVRVDIEGERKTLGSFQSEQEAALAAEQYKATR